jgi:hypothetical protein
MRHVVRSGEGRFLPVQLPPDDCEILATVTPPDSVHDQRLASSPVRSQSWHIGAEAREGAAPDLGGHPRRRFPLRLGPAAKPGTILRADGQRDVSTVDAGGLRFTEIGQRRSARTGRPPRFSGSARSAFSRRIDRVVRMTSNRSVVLVLPRASRGVV